MLDSLPVDANIWIYTASRTLTDEESSTIISSLRPFMESWTSHGRVVVGDADVYANRFLLIGAHVPGGDISGCGIDASTNAAGASRKVANVEWLGNLHIAYRTPEGLVQVVPRPIFRDYVAQGQIAPETPVFDLSITTIGQLREGRFERPFAESWQGEYFKAAHVTGN